MIFLSEETRKRIDFIVKVVYYIVLIGIAYLILRGIGLIFPFILAMGLMTLFQPLIRLIHRKLRINQKVVSVITIALLYVGVGSLIFWIVIQIVYLLKDLFTIFPDYYYNTIAPNIVEFGNWMEKQLASLQMSWGTVFDEVQSSLLNGLQNFVVSMSQAGVSFVTDFVNSVPSFFMSLIFTILLSFFISFQYDKVVEFLKNQLPPKAIEFVGGLKSMLKNTVFRYGKAYLILMIITFTELTIGFLIIGVSNPVGMAAGIAVFDMFPVFGTGGIMIPWIIIELLQGNFSYAIALAILYAIVTVIRNIIEPKVVGDQLGINPIISLLAVFIGYKLIGAIGMIVFPMLAQIIIALHQNGTIRLYKEN